MKCPSCNCELELSLIHSQETKTACDGEIDSSANKSLNTTVKGRQSKTPDSSIHQQIRDEIDKDYKVVKGKGGCSNE